MSEAPGSRSGSMFGPYHLKRPLGRGGMGEVYEAEHTVKGWTVAVKLMSDAVSKDPVFRERMKREARIAGRLQEPHVVPIHDYGEIDGLMFLEMRLIEGRDLDHMLKEQGPLAPPRAVALITQVASALDAAHAVGVTHRDVKPPNVLVTGNDFAYLVDFGIASAKSDEKLTQMGTAVGTWKYMAPERFTNDDVDSRADVYSLACVLYECLTGSAPYPGDSAGVLISAHMLNPVPRPSAARPGIPRALDAVIARGMAKSPDERYASAGDLAKAAHEALSVPDRDHAAAIMRRSQESVLPPRLVKPQPVPAPPRPLPPMPPRPTPVPPSGPQSWSPNSGPMQPPSGPIPRHPLPQPFAAPVPPWGHPPPVQRGRNTWLIVAGAVAVVLVVLIGAIGIWAATKDDNVQAGHQTTSTTRTTTRTTTTRTTTTSPPTTTMSRDQARLMTLLPPGYAPSSCKPDTKPAPGSLVSVTCGQNNDANGPKVSAFALYADIGSLKNGFTAFMSTFTAQPCPGANSSPTNWWHSKDPKTILGQIACGVYKGADPQVMWTNEQTLVFGLASAKQQAPTLDQLYKWWTSHS